MSMAKVFIPIFSNFWIDYRHIYLAKMPHCNRALCPKSSTHESKVISYTSPYTIKLMLVKISDTNPNLFFLHLF